MDGNYMVFNNLESNKISKFYDGNTKKVIIIQEETVSKVDNAFNPVMVGLFHGS